MSQMLGNGSLCFSKAPFIVSTASVVGKKEGEGPLGDCFDVVGMDEKFGEENWEAAESALHKGALALALGKINCKSKDVRYLFAGDLLGQTIASSFGLKEFEIEGRNLTHHYLYDSDSPFCDYYKKATEILERA